MPDLLVSVLSILAMVLGFGAIIAVHEFGHFIAARWAGIRVHAFAIGFGPAMLSYRRGLGWRGGSTEGEYASVLLNRGLEAGDASAPSATEYRLNWFPFGGYVKMLGQEDMNPGAVSGEPDSYQSKSVWERLVVISAGVVMNIALAALLFVVVYMVGIGKPAAIAGEPRPGTPASEAGLVVGDEIVSVNGGRVREMNGAVVRVALAGGGEDVVLSVRRGGEVREVRVTPEREGMIGSGLRQIGLVPARGLWMWPEPLRASERATVDLMRARAGLGSVPHGSRLVSVDGELLPRYELSNGQGHGLFADAEGLIEGVGAGGEAALVFEGPGGGSVRVEADVSASFESGAARVGVVGGGEAAFAVEHLLGLMPLAKVSEWSLASPRAGLEPGDVFLRVGSVAYPSVAAAVEEIRSRAGGRVELLVMREGEGGERVGVLIDAPVDRSGRVGFTPGEAWGLAVVGSGVGLVDGEGGVEETPASRLADGLEPVLAGTRVLAVVGEGGERVAVEGFGGLREALRVVTAGAFEAGEGARVLLECEVLGSASEGGSPLGSAGSTAAEVPFSLGAGEVERLHGLGSEVRGLGALFRPVEVRVEASGPVEAVVMGVGATERILSQTYLTLRRLVEGSVPVNKLQGPVGITYTGSRFAEQGLMHFLFFLALISANLAVINFLPIPITDGGQFLLLLWEWVRGKPAPMAVQSGLTIAGLLLIGAVFLYVTFHDILRLF